jgi:hypothetical protein
MPLVVPNIGETRLLRFLIGNASPTNLQLHLFTAPTSSSFPTEDTVIGDFTTATASGYAPATLSTASWSVGTDAGVSSALYNFGITFTFGTASGTQNVYGYYVSDNTGNLLWAERFPGAPFALPQTGGEIAIRPQVQLS